MVNLFVKDITEGIAGTGIKAGVIKCATDRPGITPGVERVLRACAQTHRATGTPITTHTDAASRRGLEQQEIFKSEGVDLDRVVIGHSGDTEDLAYLEELIANGSILGMDRFGIDGLLPTEKRVGVIAELCQRGYADRMVLSHDASCYLDWIPGEIPPAYDAELALPPHQSRRDPGAARGRRHGGADRHDAGRHAAALPGEHRGVLALRPVATSPKSGESRDGVPLTNLDQPLFDGADATKRDLVDYLDGVATGSSRSWRTGRCR